MTARSFVLVFLLTSRAFPQNLLHDFSFGGSANDFIRGVAVDAAKNVYIAGSTYSADLPLRNAYQTVNSGTQLISSSNGGANWTPISSPFQSANTSQPLNLAVDPTNPATIYVASGRSVCKSTSGGPNLKCVAITSDLQNTNQDVLNLAIDPNQPSILFASTNAGLYRSADGGSSWAPSGTGLPDGFGNVSFDPFHPGVLFAFGGSGGYVSQDGGAAWTKNSLPWPAGTTSYEPYFIFDPLKQGVIYGPDYSFNVQRSVDGGLTWKALNAPFLSFFVAVDPQTTGVLYAFGPTSQNNPVNYFWKSTDSGDSWTSYPIPAGATGPLVVDPADPNVILAGTFRTIDGGKTWTATNASRAIQPIFAASQPSTVYAVAPLTPDAFVAKFSPEGALIFSTYFGGMGDDAVGSIALDASGNIWITGSTSSFDLPMTHGAYQSLLNGSQNGFVAEFSNDGKLRASTYLGGSGQDQLYGIAVSPNGNPWVIGARRSADFPFPGGAQPVPPFPNSALIAEFDPSLSQLLFATQADGTFDPNGKGIAIDPSGNVTVAGGTYDSKFQSTVSPLPTSAPAVGSSKPFVAKFDSSGKQTYSTMFGGSNSVQSPSNADSEKETGVSVAVDSVGNAYLTGTTSAADFPVTAGSYQAAIADGCPYPAFTQSSGFFGVIFSYFIDDVFVVKLSPDGKTALLSTLLGGSCYDRPTEIALDPSGRIVVTGETDSEDFPTVAPLAGAPAYRQFASFVSVLDPAGAALRLSTYLYAGSSPSVATGPDGSLYVAGAEGSGAQTAPDSGYVNYPMVAADGYLAAIQPPETAPAIVLSQARNAFSLLTGPVAPGEIVALTMPGFMPSSPADIGLNALAPLATALSGVQVFFDGKPGYLISVAPGKIVCIAPVEIAGQANTSIQVTANGTPSNVLRIAVAPTALGLLSVDGSGAGYANARNADGTLNGKDNPAAQGSIVTMYVTGAGLTAPAEPDGVVVAGFGTVPVATLSYSYGSGPCEALLGFVPGIFSCQVAVPQDPNIQRDLQVYVESETSLSQGLFIYVRSGTP